MLDYHVSHPLDGYRRLAFMMLDDDIVAVSPSSVYRVLKQANRLDRKWQKTSKKGTGFVQPLAPHKHWHVDISYLNLGGTFYYLCSLLDGYSRFIVHWEIRESMTEQDVETIIQRAREKFPGETPRIISDNGPPTNAARRCPIAKDFKAFIRLCGMTHVRTSPADVEGGQRILLAEVGNPVDDGFGRLLKLVSRLVSFSIDQMKGVFSIGPIDADTDDVVGCGVFRSGCLRLHDGLP